MFCALRQELEGRRFSPGQQFYTIKEICSEHHVSTSTVIRCLDRLESEGLIERRRWSGIYVKHALTPAQKDVAAVQCVDCVTPEDIVSRGGPELLTDELLVSLTRTTDEAASCLLK